MVAMTVTQPPIIDAQGLFKDASKRHVTVDPEEFGSVAEQVEEASRTWGVFRITNHGFDENILKETVEMVQEFFDLPDETKSFVERTANNPSGWSNSELTKQALDLKEIFDYCYIPHRDKPDDHPSNRGIDGWNRFMDSRMREVFLRYFDHVEECCYRLLQVLCMALDIDYEYAKRLFTGESCGFCRMNFYKGLKEIENDGQRYGIHDHTDAGFFTILWTSMARGIEFYHDGRWVTLEPLAGSFTINVGDMCQVLTNGLFAAPVHRVIIKEDVRRYSMAFFFNPSPKARIKPIEPCIQKSGRPSMYKDISWSEFRNQRFAGDYADEGKEVQISDYLHHE
ncbi:Putative 2-oxoglutarate-dependent dioxygenase [Picochlorum sp. SENEW3]|nr:Putative 2-oxoglutarate-dependent dioxygenase [Picochlorum sp. SENEW3]